MNSAFFVIALLICLAGCTPKESKTVALLQCIDCHSVEADSNHPLPCISCHKGNNPAGDRESAHQGYIPAPAGPAHLVQSCGACHGEITRSIGDSLHFTLRNSTNLFRKAFGAGQELVGFRDTPKGSSPETVLDLADDLLRRRCFRCHPYNSGEAYPLVAHGTGCAACHMTFAEGKPHSHRLQRPGDAQCLSCHYGNYVGFDYYGRFEHDFNVEYRTPFTTKGQYFRPYGIEYHQLQPDVHQTRGMGCIDCHSGLELMGAGGAKPSCAGCHRREELQRFLPARVEKRQGGFFLLGSDGQDRSIPLLHHPAHRQYPDRVACQACHAQWTFNDIGKHFLRSDSDDADVWANLSTQGSLEVETIIDNNNDFDKTELPLRMTDKITGVPETGLWHKGFLMRRWETITLGRDDQGLITPMRPVLDYALSWVDEEENVRFDSVIASAPDLGWRPYVPHTTGPAGLFYQERLARFLAGERTAADRGQLAEPARAVDPR